MEYGWLAFGLFFVAGYAAGFVDSIAGGGGLISLPVLLAAGMPPHLALGTNKLQSSFGSFTASWNYIRKGVVNIRDTIRGICFTALGAATGAIVVQVLDAGFIRHLIPLLLLAVLVYMFTVKDLGLVDRAARMPSSLFFTLFGCLLGFYDGFFGPGTGSFWTAAMLVGLGFNMTRAAGTTRVLNFTSNVVALGMFLVQGNVLFGVGLCMAAGQAAGARTGSGMAILRGSAFIRPIFIGVVLATICRLLYQNYM